jgi:hypothetical protein
VTRLLPALGGGLRLGAWALTAALILNASFLDPIGLYDEGFTLTNALRLLRHEVPHADYWSAYPPGTALVLALAFAALEPTLLVARWVNAAWLALLVVASYALFAQLQSRTVATLLTLVLAGWAGTALYPSYSATAALALAMTVGALLVAPPAAHRRRATWAAALLAGLIVILRHDFALYTVCAGSAALLIDGYCSRPAATPGPRRSPPFAAALSFGAAAVAVGLGLGAALLLWSGVDPVVDQMIRFPATGMREHRLLPVPPWSSLFTGSLSRWALAWCVPLVLVAGTLLSRRTGAWETSPRRRALLFSAAMCGLLLIQSRNRFDLSHAVPSILFALIVIAAACVLGPESGGSRRVRVASLGLMLGFLSYSAVYLTQSSAARPHVDCWWPGRAGHCMPPRPEQAAVVAYLQARTTAAEPVFVGNTRHDELFIHDASLYFLLRRPVPIRWNEMHPGIVTTREVQSAIIQSLEQKQVRYAVLVDLERSAEPNRSAVSSGVFLLDKYLRRHYAPAFRRGQYVVYRRHAPGNAE